MEVVPLLSIDRNVLGVAREQASVVHAHPDRHTARHCAVVIREDFEEYQNKRVIVSAALTERGHAGADGHLRLLCTLSGLTQKPSGFIGLRSMFFFFFVFFMIVG